MKPTKTTRGTCEGCGVPVIGERADERVWAHCICAGCLPPAPPLPIASFGKVGVPR
jgi:hypothetical protein